MTDLALVERHARALMTAHGVGSLGFEFDRGKRRIGAMHYRRVGDLTIPVKITLSRHYAVLLTMDEIRETMLHEIAHALAPGDGHGYLWQRKARELGVKPSPCKATSARPDHSVEGRCSTCGQVVGQQHRLPLRVYFHGKCGLRLDRGLAVWYRNGVKVPVGQMPDRYRIEYNRIANKQGFAPVYKEV